MGRTTGIEWTDATWNPIRGCSRVSEGCRHCYAEGIAARFSGEGQAFEGLAEFKNHDARWTGKIRFIDDHLEDPLRWKTGRRIFVNSMSDLFHPEVTGDMLAEIFSVMAQAPQHTYQILTKRPERMREALAAGNNPVVADQFTRTYSQPFPPPNWWFGVSVEDHKTALERIPILAECGAAVRFVSYEPALGPIYWSEFSDVMIACIDWMICGGESGNGARPMHPSWACRTRDLCAGYEIPFFFKQWGEYGFGYSHRPGDPGKFAMLANEHFERALEVDRYPRSFDSFGSCVMERLGKAKSGSSLDGREWKEFPCRARISG